MATDFTEGIFLEMAIKAASASDYLLALVAAGFSSPVWAHRAIVIWNRQHPDQQIPRPGPR